MNEVIENQNAIDDALAKVRGELEASMVEIPKFGSNDECLQNLTKRLFDLEVSLRMCVGSTDDAAKRAAKRVAVAAIRLMSEA